MKLTDRNQVVLPGKIEGNEPWVGNLPRVVNPQDYLCMPPGEDAAGPNDWGDTSLKAAGSTDVSMDATDSAAKKGYTRLPSKPYDDQYTGEHTDGFYDSVVVDGEEGAIERNNYLDRST